MRLGEFDIVDPEDLSNYVEDYGEGPEVPDEPVMHQSEPLDNILKLPPGTTSGTVENLCRALSILEKEQSVIMTTKDSIDCLQNSIQKILLGYSRTLLTMHDANDLDKLTNSTADLAKTIIHEFHSMLTTVQMNPIVDLSGKESYMADQQSGDDPHELKADSRTDNPCKSSSSEHVMGLEVQLNKVKINDIDETSQLPNAQNYCNGLIDYKNTERITKLKHFEEDGEKTSRSKLEMSITNTCRNFMARNQSQVIFDRVWPEEKFDPLVNCLKDTNPFKEDVMRINSAASSEVPPPIPPRFNQSIGDNSVETLSSIIPQPITKFVYSAAPVMYTSSQTNTLLETIHESKRVDLCVEDDDTGYQSDAASPILKRSIPQQGKQVLKVSEEKSYEDSQVNNGGLVIDDYSVKELSKDDNFSLVSLTYTDVTVFNLKGEGWIPGWEFLKIFAPDDGTDNFRKILNTAIPSEAILLFERKKNSALFDRYIRTMSHFMPKDHSSEFIVLIQLSSILKILSKMRIMTMEEISLQRERNGLPDYESSRVMADVIKLISTYGSIYGCKRVTRRI